MEVKLVVTSAQLNQKHIDNELFQQRAQFNKNMLQKLNEKALDRAFQLERHSA